MFRKALGIHGCLLQLDGRVALVTALSAMALGTSACGGDGGTGASGDDGVGGFGATDGLDGGDEGADAGDGDGDGGTPKFDLPDEAPAITSIRIEPADVVMEVVNGAIPAAVDFDAIGTTAKGEEVVLDDLGSFTFSRPDLGKIAIQDGVFDANGDLGGKGTVEFEYEDGRKADTSAAVKLSYTYDPSATPSGIKTAFDGATVADPTMDMLYPYDETVFPLGLTGPVIQWNGGAAGDLYKISADSEYFSFETYVTADPPSRYAFPDASLLPKDIWKQMTESTQGDLEVAVQRFDTANQVAYQPNIRNWTISQANLTGILYYWEINNGEVVKLEVGDAAPQQFLTKPAGETCTACHSVSADGSTIVAPNHGGGNYPWASWNPDGSIRYETSSNGGDPSGFLAVSPDGGFVVTGQRTGAATLKMSSSTDKTALATLNPPAGAAVNPAWSPSGGKVAYTARNDGNWVDYNSGGLWVADVDMVTPGFSNYMEIAPSDPTLPVSTWPTFSPDSSWVAFNKSSKSRTRDAITELHMVKADGTATVRLDRANGLNAISAAEQQMNYEPTFMPVSVGGYFWLVFGSERSYGNTLAHNTKQLWVTAIDANMDGSKDPSHPAFWLPGQETNNQNMRGNWALEPCRAKGDTCESGFDCCTGFCSDDGTGNKTCSEDVPECSAVGDACDTAADCCSTTAQCIGGFCAEIVPG